MNAMLNMTKIIATTETNAVNGEGRTRLQDGAFRQFFRRLMKAKGANPDRSCLGRPPRAGVD
jgi:hypothetical protein